MILIMIGNLSCTAFSMKTSIVPLAGVSQRQSWKSCPCYLQIWINLWPQQEPVMCCMHCFHPELASCGATREKMNEICPRTFLISEGKNNYPWGWLTPFGSVN